MAGERVRGDMLDAVFMSDDASLADAYRLRLELDGYEVRTAADPIEAFRAVRMREPDIVFVDRTLSSDAADTLLTLLARLPNKQFAVVCLERSTADDEHRLCPMGISYVLVAAPDAA